MSKPTLTVVIPAYNSQAHIRTTVDALVAAVSQSPFETDAVLVDDGSTDGTADAAVAACADRLRLRVIAQPNRGRFEARRAGLEVATGQWVLLLDSRVTLEASSLAFAAERLDQGERVWNGHVHVHADGNLCATFWRLLAELAWPDYFDEPRSTSFGAADFDRYPKGTTCFLAPRDTLLTAVSAFRSQYADLRLANDDTPLIRSIAKRERIFLSPRFACDYSPRTSFGSFLRHSYHRGIVFLDGHGRRESRLFPAVIAFFPVSAAISVAALRRPIATAAFGLAAVGMTAAGLGITKRRTPFEVAALASLAPIYAAAHGAGMWRGLMIRGRAGRRPRLSAT